MKELKRQFCIRWEEIVFTIGLEAGFFLFSEVMLAVLVYGAGSKSSIFLLGTMMVLAVPVFAMVFVGMCSLSLYFNMAVSFGAARRREVPAILGMSMITNVLAACGAWLFYQLEKLIFRIAYKGIQIEFDLQFVFQWKYILPVCLAIVALNALMGAMFLKYGKIAFNVFWILWMVIFIGIPRIAHLLNQSYNHPFLKFCRKIGTVLLGLSADEIMLVIVAVSFGILFISWMMLRKQSVNF